MQIFQELCVQKFLKKLLKTKCVRILGHSVVVYTYQVCVELPASALNMTLAALPHLLLNTGACSTALVAHPQLSINISCPQGAQQQNHRPPLLLSIDGTDRRTDARPLHKPRCAYNAGSANKFTSMPAWMIIK